LALVAKGLGTRRFLDVVRSPRRDKRRTRCVAWPTSATSTAMSSACTSPKARAAPGKLRRPLAQVMARVPAGVLLEIVLVILGGALVIGRLHRGDLRDDGRLPVAALRDTGLDLLGGGALSVGQCEDGGAVLLADVIALLIHMGRVVHSEVPV